MKIVLLGPPGAGKGTQAKVLAERLKLPHISTGDILRKNTAQNTELGRKAKEYMNKGALVPDELVGSMLIQRIDEPDTADGFILDGYPRNLNQATTLDAMLKERGMDINLVFYLDASEKVIVQRISGRLVCQGCGMNYHVKNMAPKQEGICDKCGKRLYQRSDDNENTVKARLEVYKKESEPLIKYYQQKNKLHRVSADGEAGVVLEELIRLARGCDDSLKV